MEAANLVNAVVAFCQSDPVTVGLPLDMILETAYAAGSFKNNPARIPLNIASSVAFGAAATGVLHLAGIESQEVVNYAFAIGYVFPSAVRLLREIACHDQDSGQVIPFAISGTIAAGIGLINMAVGSFDIYHFAQVEKFFSAMDFFGNALNQFGKKLPSLIERIKNITK